MSRWTAFNALDKVFSKTLTSASEPNIVRSENEDFEIHELPEAFLKDCVNALENYDRCRFDFLQN